MSRRLRGSEAVFFTQNPQGVKGGLNKVAAGLYVSFLSFLLVDTQDTAQCQYI